MNRELKEKFYRFANGETWGSVFGSIRVEFLFTRLIVYVVELEKRISELENEKKKDT